MNPHELVDALSNLGLSKSDLAKLIRVTQRAVNLWCSGNREIPGPVIAYLTLLQSLPAALQAEEISKIQENSMKYDGMYEISYSGRSGYGTCVLILMSGQVFGHDGGVLYDGTYEPDTDDPALMNLKLQLTVPPGVALVQGVPAQPAEYKFPLNVTVPARGTANLKVVTPYGPVSCSMRFVRRLPEQLAA
jgi:predicted transcriptional regulator